jgi:DNA-binding response OmpR family regulator
LQHNAWAFGPVYVFAHPHSHRRTGHVEPLMPSDPQTAGARILVVDDDPNLLRMLRRGLVLAGYTVEAVEDGETALSTVRELEPDLVVLDVMLPESPDGLEIARRLRVAGSEAPILMLTPRGHLADTPAGVQRGADDYLPKPFAFEELLARVGALLRRRVLGADG